MIKPWSDPESWSIVMRQALMTAKHRGERVRVVAVHRSARSLRVAPGSPWVYLIKCTQPYCAKCSGVDEVL